MILDDFDWKHPDYVPIYRQRKRTLDFIREHPGTAEKMAEYYRDNPADFIDDWGMTYDPRNAERDLPTVVPFLLFPKQREMIDYVLDRWRAGRPGLIEKSRDAGASYVAIALACAMCIFRGPLSIGFGSRKEEYVDKSDNPKSLFWKARLFMNHLPVEFNGGYLSWRDAPYMRVRFPSTMSIITGEAGDSIGRGDRTALYFVDEAAHLERPKLVDFSLQATTNCRIDISSVNGMNNPFAEKRHGGKIEVFIFDWRDDPRKDEAWYAKQCEDHDPVVVAQEVDRDYAASVSGIVIPAKWARACLDARQKLGLKPTGRKLLALDIADEGADKNAVVGGQGVEISVAEEWSGKDSDTFHTVNRSAELADEHDCQRIRYDSDGLGALVRGDARVMNEQRRANNAPAISYEAFRGSEAVFDPEGIVEGTIGNEGKGRTNQDYFANRKAQGWWALRRRCLRTYRWVMEGKPCDPDEILSIDSKMPNAMKLVAELSQPTYSQNGAGKMVINKKPDGMKSPNLGDGAMIRFAPNETPMEVTGDMIAAIQQFGQQQRARRRFR